MEMTIEDFSNLVVLTLDDEPAYRKVLKKILEKFFNVKVYEAENPKEAFDFMKNKIPDLLFLDMQMPYMDGLSVLKILREEKLTANLPVIACTALASHDLTSSLFKLQISDFILKPFSDATVVTKVKKVLEAIVASKASKDNHGNN